MGGIDENYILAGNETLSHVLDYEGNVLNEFINMSNAFVMKTASLGQQYAYLPHCVSPSSTSGAAIIPPVE